jgi:hypothetical protein
VARGLPVFHPWHLFAMYPFVTVSVVTSIWLLQRSLTRWIPADACLGAVALLVAAMLTYNVTTYARYVEAFDKPPLAIAWSAKIYELIAYTQAEPARFASLDWGIHNQLIVFTAQRGKYVDLTSQLNRVALGDSEEREVAERYLDPVRDYEFIAHPVGRTVFPTARAQLFAIAARRGYHLSLHRVIADGGQPVFEIYRSQAAEGATINLRVKQPHPGLHESSVLSLYSSLAGIVPLRGPGPARHHPFPSGCSTVTLRCPHQAGAR